MPESSEPGEQVGVPDALERLWTPHRMTYVSGSDRPTGGYEVPTGGRRTG